MAVSHNAVDSVRLDIVWASVSLKLSFGVRRMQRGKQSICKCSSLSIPWFGRPYSVNRPTLWNAAMKIVTNVSFEDQSFSFNLVVMCVISVITLWWSFADMITDHEPIVNKFISVPKDFSQLNCAAFLAGIVEAILDGSQFVGFKCIIPYGCIPHFNFLG